MDTSLGARLITDAKTLYRKGDSVRLKEQISLNLDYAKKFVQYPLTNKVLGSDVFELKRGNGKELSIYLIRRDQSGTILNKVTIADRLKYFLQSKFSPFEFADIIAIFACEKAGIKEPAANASWLRTFFMHLIKTKPDEVAKLNKNKTQQLLLTNSGN